MESTFFKLALILVGTAEKTSPGRRTGGVPLGTQWLDFMRFRRLQPPRQAIFYHGEVFTLATTDSALGPGALRALRLPDSEAEAEEWALAAQQNMDGRTLGHGWVPVAVFQQGQGQQAGQLLETMLSLSTPHAPAPAPLPVSAWATWGAHPALVATPAIESPHPFVLASQATPPTTAPTTAPTTRSPSSPASTKMGANDFTSSPSQPPTFVPTTHSPTSPTHSPIPPTRSPTSPTHSPNSTFAPAPVYPRLLSKLPKPVRGYGAKDSDAFVTWWNKQIRPRQRQYDQYQKQYSELMAQRGWLYTFNHDWPNP